MSYYTEEKWIIAKQQLTKLVSEQFVIKYLTHNFLPEAQIKLYDDYSFIKESIGSDEQKNIINGLRSEDEVNINGALSQIFCTAYFAHCGFDVGPPVINPNGKKCDFTFKNPEFEEPISVEVFHVPESSKIKKSTDELLNKVFEEPGVLHSVEVPLIDLKRKVERKNSKHQLKKIDPNILVVHIRTIDKLGSGFIQDALSKGNNTRLTAVVALWGGFRPNSNTNSLSYEYTSRTFKHPNPSALIDNEIFKKIDRCVRPIRFEF